MKLLKEFSISDILYEYDFDSEWDEAINRLIVRFGSKYGIKFNIPEKELLGVLKEEKDIKELLIYLEWLEEDEKTYGKGDIFRFTNYYYLLVSDACVYSMICLDSGNHGRVTEIPKEGITLSHLIENHFNKSDNLEYIGHIKEFVNWRKLESC